MLKSRVILLLAFSTILNFYSCKNVDSRSSKLSMEFQHVNLDLKKINELFQDNLLLVESDTIVIFRYIESVCTACNLRSCEILEEILDISPVYNSVVIITKFRNTSQEKVFKRNYLARAIVIYSQDTLVTFNNLPIKSSCFLLLDSQHNLVNCTFPEFEDSQAFLESLSILTQD